MLNFQYKLFKKGYWLIVNKRIGRHEGLSKNEKEDVTRDGVFGINELPVL